MFRAAAYDAGAVNQNIEPSIAAHVCLYRGLVANVQRHRALRAKAAAARSKLRFGNCGACDRNRRTQCSERIANGGADATGASRHERDLSG